MRRRRQHQPRRDRGDQQPVDLPPQRRARFVGDGGVRLNPSVPARRRRARDEQDEQHIARGPAPALRGERHRGFDERRIADQARKAAEVRRGVEIIGVAGAGIGGEPALHQRRLRRHDEENGADRRKQEQGHPQRLLPRAGRCELRDTDREPERGDEKKRKMDDRLPPHGKAAEPVRIGVAAEQQCLIDEHRAVPHRGRAAELGQHHPRDHRLDEEEEKAADEDRQHEQPAARRQRRCHAVFHVERGNE